MVQITTWNRTAGKEVKTITMEEAKKIFTKRQFQKLLELGVTSNSKATAIIK